ncbi:MAG TPA: hypothetical protein VE269_07070, partial [Gaiellaceae bacterium]|nr:hypothetical protein [Gaiellaceae bacterium]
MDLRLAFDRAVGDVVERTVRSHHHRRLRRLGWRHALEPDDALWVSGEPPPRAGNDVEVLIDGAEALPRIAAEIASARSHVNIAGWHVAPWFDLTRDGTRAELRPLLERIAAKLDVRMLVWAGSPLPLFHPDRRDVDGVRHAFEAGSRIRFATDAKERPMHCHHEKLVIVDDEIAFVGGIDLTTLAGDRYDHNGHPCRDPAIGWHDASTRIRGPLVRDVAAHFALRWEAVTGQALA